MSASAAYERLFLSEQLCFPIYSLSRLTVQLYTPILTELDLTYPQYLVMMVLWEEREKSVTAIGERLLLETSTLTPLIKRLAQKGFVEKRRSTTDERSVLVALTAKGWALREQAVDIPDRILASLSPGTFAEEELLDFRRTLQKMLAFLQDQKS